MTSTLLEHRTGAGEDAYSPNPSDAQLDLLADFRSELQQLTATQRELLHELRSDGVIDLDADELPRLRRANEELRSRVEQLERMLLAAPAGEDVWVQRQNEYEKLLEEKSEVIRALHLKVQQWQEGVTPGAPAPEIHDAALDISKQQLEDQRAQLDEDEANMMQQMRTMEMALAKDRADLARRRTELQRQQADFAREIENASRDPQLHDRLISLRRRPQENAAKSVAEVPAVKTAAPSLKNSGLIRRIFG